LFLSLNTMKKFILLFCILISSTFYGQNEFMLAERYFSDGEFEKASQLYKDLYTKNPNNTTYLKRLISAYQENAQFEIVEKLLQQHLLVNPTHSYLNVELGYNYEKQQQKEKAKI
jgi:tetratricopeptide (TPR) repeat protein